MPYSYLICVKYENSIFCITVVFKADSRVRNFDIAFDLFFTVINFSFRDFKILLDYLLLAVENTRSAHALYIDVLLMLYCTIEGG